MAYREYGTLSNGVITYAPRPLVAEGCDVWTNDPAIYLEHGYKRIVETARPTDAGYTYTSGWTEDATAITRTWTATPIPAPEPTEEADMAEALGIVGVVPVEEAV